MKLAPVLLVTCAVAMAQPYDNFRGRITGGDGDRGKCTVEVSVDGSAEIEVLGADGRMNTLSGARASWRSMECNMGVPANPAEFKFTPQSGRGKQYIVRQPQENRGIAVVRIEDPSGGSANYRFDLEWRGSGGPATGGFNNGGSIFDPAPRGPNNFPSPNQPQPSFPSGPSGPSGPAIAGWNDQVDFRARGDGYYRSFRGSDDMLTDVVVTIDRGGRVQVDLTTNRRDRIVINGRLVMADGDRLVANMAGGALQGTMEILLDSRNRVQELAMTGVGRNRFELRWQPR